MKISQMLAREDFLNINQRTLDDFFGSSFGKEIKLYIYPRLNAIVTSKPSKRVIDYLLCEYSVRGSAAKRFAARVFVLSCMHSSGVLASKHCTVKANVHSEMLIYPCNKKYRIFDFKENYVDVIAKNGFDKSDLIHEIEFRSREGLPDFVPRIISSDTNGYRETIIDGCPLPRISEGFDSYRDIAYEKINQFGKLMQRTISAPDYINSLRLRIGEYMEKKVGGVLCVKKIVDHLSATGADGEDILLTFSHGDLQAGNIWVENGTKHIYIIDWESWGERSVWYDYATLYQGLRSGDLQYYCAQETSAQERAVVLLEDLVFRLQEVNNLPGDYGVTQFEQYCNGIVRELQIGG